MVNRTTTKTLGVAVLVVKGLLMALVPALIVNLIWPAAAIPVFLAFAGYWTWIYLKTARQLNSSGELDAFLDEPEPRTGDDKNA
jgi:hypothetical protein